MTEFKENTDIGIVGAGGFVGIALYEGMKHASKIFCFDKFKKEVSNTESVQDLVDRVNVIFVCVPTPMFKNGQCDTSIVESVVKELDVASHIKHEREHCWGVTVVIKSTVPPGTTEYLDSICKWIEVVFNPEFLTEKNSINDFKNQSRIILGGELAAIKIVADIYRNAYPSVPIVGLESKAAEMVKYVTNCFLAMKVSFANEIYQICDKLDISYEGVISASMLDDRLGQSHWQVPGPDGLFGWGLSCFPKDLNALTYVSKMLGIKPVMLEATWEKNLEVRKSEDRDWERMSKAVVDVK